MLLFTEQPRLQPVEVDVDDRRREQREHLTDEQAADHCVAERLADLGALTKPRTLKQKARRFPLLRRRHRCAM